ncbi:TolC family outer membrane protein [Fretibacter rubidus]|uniref:TolC family outer membrane protein n=1 Tax=Fretibacter rubidus TaxID=570162 RepID=UPI00352B2123
MRSYQTKMGFVRRVVLAGTACIAALSMTLSTNVSAETFQEALIAAYHNNPRLKAERTRVREIDENYIQARAQGRVSSSLSGSVSGSVARFPAQSFFGPGGLDTISGTPADAAVQVIQPLYQGGRVKALKKQAKSAIYAAREGLRNAEQNLFVSVATAYVDVKRDEETARIRRNNVSVLARQEQAARDRFDVGEGTLTDIAQAESRLAGANIGLAQAEAQLAASRASYERVVGKPPSLLSTTPRFILPSSMTQAQEVGRANNPQLVAAIFNQIAARNGIAVAKSANKPTVSLAGTASAAREQLGQFTRSDNASLSLQVTVPLYSGGANKSRVRQARLAVERLGYEVTDTQDAIDQTIAQIWAQLEAAKISLSASQRQVDAANVAFEGVTLEQQLGQRDTLDVLNAEQEVLNAKLSVVDAQRAVDATTFQLLSVMGAFDAESLQLPVDLYDPSENFEAIKIDGMTRAIDNYVPEIVEDAVDEIADIPGDVIDLGQALRIDDAGREVGRNVGVFGHGVGTLVKDGVDTVSKPVTDIEFSDELPKFIKSMGTGMIDTAGKVGNAIGGTVKTGVDSATGYQTGADADKSQD